MQAPAKAPTSEVARPRGTDEGVPQRSPVSSGRPERSRPHAVVVLRMRLGALSIDAEADLGRVARVARTLDLGELLAVRLGVEPKLAEICPRLGDDDLRMLSCAFAPDDWEAFIWRAPPEPPPAKQAVGGAPLDVRLLPPPLPLVVPLIAVARLHPGEGILHVSDQGPPQLLMDLLAGRADAKETRGGRGSVLTLLVRRPAAPAAR
jgi:hypothetical protein